MGVQSSHGIKIKIIGRKGKAQMSPQLLSRVPLVRVLGTSSNKIGRGLLCARIQSYNTPHIISLVLTVLEKMVVSPFYNRETETQSQQIGAFEGAGDTGLAPAAHPTLVSSWAVTDQPGLLHHLYHRAKHPHPPNISKAESREAGSQDPPPPNPLLYTASSPKPSPRCHTKFARLPMR